MMDASTPYCTCFFMSNKQKQLILTKEEHLEIWGLNEASKELELVHKRRLQGDVAALVPFRISGWLPTESDGVVVISEGTDLQLLYWNNKQQGLRELCHPPNALPSRPSVKHRRGPASQAIAIGSALCCVVGGSDGQLTVALVRRNEKGPIRFSGTFHEVHSPLEDHNNGPLGSLTEILSLAFLTDREGRPEVDLHGQPFLAQLYKETGLGASSVTVVVSALDCKTGELHRCWHLRDLDSSTRVMVTTAAAGAFTSDKGAKILLLSNSGGILYARSGVFCARVQIGTEGGPTAAAQLREGLLVVGDSAGVLHVVNLCTPESAPRSLCFGPELNGHLRSGIQAIFPLVSDNGRLAFVCKTDDGEDYVITVPDDVSLCSIRRLASTELPVLAPVHDFTVVHVSPQESELVLAHGVGRHGFLTRVQEAAELIGEGLILEDLGFRISTLLPFSLANRPAVVLSYENSSRVLHQCGDDTWRPLTASGFDETVRTLAVGSVGDGGLFVQVTSASVRLIDSVHPYGLRQERTDLAPADGKPTRGAFLIHLADVSGCEIVVAGKDQLRTFRFRTSTGLLEDIACRKCDSQISAVSLSIRSEDGLERKASNGQASTSGAFASGSKKQGFQSTEPDGTNGMNGMRITHGNGLGQSGPDGPEALRGAAYVVVGYWTTHVVEILWCSDLQMVTRVQLGGCDLPRSVKLIEVGGVNKLLVGTAGGSVLCYGSGQVADIHTGLESRVEVGSAPVSLSVLGPDLARGELTESLGGLQRAREDLENGTGAAGLGAESLNEGRKERTRLEENTGSKEDRHVVQMYAQSERAALLNLTGSSASGNGNGLDALRVVGGDGWLHMACFSPDAWLVVSDDGRIRTASLDTRVRTRRRTAGLEATPRMVACHVSKTCLVAACASEQGAHSLRVFHARTLQQLAYVSLDRGHVPTCLLSAVLPVRSVAAQSYESNGTDPDVAQETGEFLVVASTLVTEERTVSVLSVFDVEERPVEDDRVEFRLFLLGSYVAGSVICSVTTVSVAPNEESSMGDEHSGGNFTDSARKASGVAQPTPMLAIGTHEGLQVLSVTVDRTGQAAVAALESQAVRVALTEDELSVTPTSADGVTNVLDTTSEQDPVAVTCRERREQNSASNGEEVGLLVVKVDAETQLPAAVTNVKASDNVLFVCMDYGALLVYETVKTSAGVQLLPRARAGYDFAPPTSVFPLSTSRVLVDFREFRSIMINERNTAGEAEFQETQKRAAVRIGEARGLDLLEPARGTEDRPRPAVFMKELPQLKGATMLKYRREQEVVGCCRLRRGLRQTGDEKRQSGVLGLEQDLVAVLANGFTLPLPWPEAYHPL